MLKLLLRLVCIGLPMAIGLATARAETTGSIGQGDNLFEISRNGAPIVDAQLVFWHGDWSWIGVDPVTKPEAAGRRYVLVGTAGAELLTLSADVDVSSEAGKGIAKWAFRFSEDPSGPKDVFGGIAFHISTPSLKRDGFDPTAELLPDKKGWSLKLSPDEPPLTVTFDGPVQSVDFEMGNRGEIRAYVLAKNESADAVAVQMTVSVPGKFSLSPAERLAKPGPGWWVNELHWNRAPVDLSFLNAAEKPAGKHGFLRAKGEDLVFDDGTEARFWGTNVVAYALFSYTNPEVIRSQVKRLSKLGFNLVRLHHHDSSWVDPNVFGRSPESTRQLDEFALKKLDWWIKCLKDEGIYVWLDLHVGRMLTENDDIDDFDEIAKGSPPRADMHGYLYVNDSMKERSKEFANAYLTRVNEYTGLAYKDDPAIVGILLTNEDDLTEHYGNALLPDKNVPAHTKRYLKLAQAFADKNDLDYESVWRSWEYGPAKIFLADLEHRYFADMQGYLRSLGVKVPITGTSYWGGMSTAGLPGLASGDLIDAHAYGKENEIEGNPQLTPNIASWLAGGAIAGKPFTVSEWNVEPFPVFDRFQLPLYIASIGRLQGWNGLMQYAYTQAAFSGMAPMGDWEATTDPGLMALMPAAALLFRRGDVSNAHKSYELSLDAETLTGSPINAQTSRAIRTLTETSKLRIRMPEIAALPWLEPAPKDEAAITISDPQFDAIGADQAKSCSDTDEICRDWKRGIFTVNTEKSQIASGWIGNQSIMLKDVTLALETPNAAVAVQSLDGAPISEAKRLMISASAQALPRTKGRLPFISEPVVGTLEIHAPPGLKAYSADRDGKLHSVPFEATANGYRLKLTPETKSNWLFLQ